MESATEICQRSCLQNALNAWQDGFLTSQRTLLYMHENYDIFRAYEKHMSKFEQIETEEQATEFITKFLAIAIPFEKLASTEQSMKNFDARIIIEELGHNYEEMIAKSLIVEQWAQTIDAIHWDCIERAESELVFKKKNNTALTDKQFDEYFEEYRRWQRISKGKEQPRVPINITLRKQAMENNEKHATSNQEIATDIKQPETQEEARVNAYLKQKEKLKPGIIFQAKQRDDQTFVLHYKDEDKISNNNILASYHRATGSTNEQYAFNSFTGAVNTTCCGDKNEKSMTDKINAFFGALTEMGPRDITDGILCRRILVLEQHINKYLGVATIPGQNLNAVDRCISNATKLSRILNETIDTRNKYLRQGEQKVTVTHQHVNVQGGQTIISGNINNEGRGNEKK